MTRPRYVCGACGRDLSDRPPAQRCICGSSDRRRVDPADMYARPASPGAPAWNPLKLWATKYLQLTWNIGQLRRLSARDSAAQAEEIRGIVQTTFTAATDLGDWLTAGPEPVSVTPGDVSRLVSGPPLSVASALARPTSAAEARLVAVGFARPPRFWVELRRPGEKPVRYDALDLAERCLITWQTFLTARGVALPAW